MPKNEFLTDSRSCKIGPEKYSIFVLNTRWRFVFCFDAVNGAGGIAKYFENVSD